VARAEACVLALAGRVDRRLDAPNVDACVLMGALVDEAVKRRPGAIRVAVYRPTLRPWR